MSILNSLEKVILKIRVGNFTPDWNGASYQKVRCWCNAGTQSSLVLSFSAISYLSLCIHLFIYVRHFPPHKNAFLSLKKISRQLSPEVELLHNLSVTGAQNTLLVTGCVV